MSQKAITEALASAGGGSHWDYNRTTETVLSGGSGSGTIYITPSINNTELLITGKNLTNSTNQIATQINLPSGIILSSINLNTPFLAGAMFNNPVSGTTPTTAIGAFISDNTLTIRCTSISGATTYNFAVSSILHL